MGSENGASQSVMCTDRVRRDWHKCPSELDLLRTHVSWIGCNSFQSLVAEKSMA
jgi:hypothetical protein